LGKPRRTFTSEFKVEAVKLVTEQGRSFAEAAANLGIAESLLRKWKKDRDAQGDQALPGKGHIPALEEELRRLRAENKRLQMERDILKKATAFFAKASL
jgi:transposase